ncbi:MAG: DNA-binding domain-containing protein [Devosiaceae bacterium]|nr:DNA-binding domain-containing protein [Devosiaceae bacterium]
MPSHHKIQSRFADGLLNPDVETPKNLLGLGGEEPKKRYNVYRNNVTISLLESMRATFPVVLRLLGPQIFDPMATQFIREFPPTSPVLMTYGDGFPKFISTYDRVKQIPYLADVASCELLYLQTYHGKDADPIAIEALSTHAPETMAELKFECHPSARFFASKWPVGSIWFTNKFDDEVKPLNAERGGESVLFIRPQMEVIAHILAEDLHKFLSLIASNSSLGAAAEKVLTQFPEFDLQNALGAMFHFGLITKIH